ncbi:MAG TPA: glycosyltransferase WbuB [Sulfurovum sp. UBA12169]|nr:MAG TPA: glycosyltransferase WbuB [Sulfurovum sp. UBA12169]
MSGGTRHYDFARELIKRGHKVAIISSSFHYSKYIEMKEYEEKEHICEYVDGIEWVWLKTPPYRGNGMARVKNMLSYTRKALKIIPTLDLSKPDIIIGSSVHLFAVYAAYKLSRKYKIPFVMEVRDLWPQTLIDMGISKRHPFIIILGILERFLYRKADKIISNLPYAYEYISDYAPPQKFEWISNGVDLRNISYKEKSESSPFVVSYTGAMGVANNLGVLVEAADKLKEDKNIIFRIIGDGVEKQKLKEMVQAKGLENITIEDPVAKSQIPDILAVSDILYFNLKDSPVFRYGISSNKLFDYMAAGRVVIFSTNAANNPIKEANGGFTIAPDEVDELVATIKQIISMTHEQRTQMGRRNREYCEKFYSTKVLVDKLEKVLQDEVSNA